MRPDYQQIVELFGLVTPELDAEASEADEEFQGRDDTESGALGDRSLTEGEYDKAARHYQRAIRQAGGENPDAHVGLGATYEILEETPAALRQYNRALKVQSDNPEPYVGLGEIYKRHGHASDGLKALENAVRLEPENPYYHLKLAETLREVGYPKRALRAIQQAVLLAPATSFFHYWMGDLQIQMKEFEAALASLRAAIELSPGDDYLFQKAAVAFWGAGKHAEAIKSVRLASDLDPDKALNYGMLERFMIASGQLEEAKAEAANAQRMDNYDREMLGRLLAECGLSG